MLISAKDKRNTVKFPVNYLGTVLRLDRRSRVLWVLAVGDSPQCEGLCPMENSEASGHLNSPLVAFTDVESIRLSDKCSREDRWARQETLLISLFSVSSFPPFSFPWPGNRSPRVTLTDVSIPKMHLEDAGGERLVGVAVSEVRAATCEAQCKGWKPHFVFCHERRANTNSLLLIKPQITAWHNSSDAVHIQHVSPPPTVHRWSLTPRQR